MFNDTFFNTGEIDLLESVILNDDAIQFIRIHNTSCFVKELIWYLFYRWSEHCTNTVGLHLVHTLSSLVENISLEFT